METTSIRIWYALTFCRLYPECTAERTGSHGWQLPIAVQSLSKPHKSHGI
ncbi:MULTISPECIES: hypothetical protein [unclassified Paenibacillus]